ncbi:ABC transporter permease [Aurantibacillus circumpalustris]|uniref:ABC transporter permease n=1 Tax=Aurantibacillus circumpalustris TaxID=3036359 RepID=UPI00295BE97E|nr:ABC transporter permease [Aurantibacillus circumpalustris]
MLKNYLKIAFRNILRNRSSALINIVGLATGIATCMLIYMYVNHELSFDRFNKDSKNIYRLVFDYQFPDKLDHLAVAAPIAGITIKKDFPEVVNYTSISPYGAKLLVKYGEKKFYEENVYVADSTFFSVFDYKLISGNKNTVLSQPNTIAINETMAKKYFANENPIGKVLEYDNNDGTFASYKITGVFEDVPSNSHLVFNSLVSYKTLEVLFGAQGINSWHNAGSFVFLQLKEGTNTEIFEKKIAHLYDNYADQYQNVKASIVMHLEPLTDIHLRSDKLFDAAVKGNLTYIYIFAVVALFLLTIACINYINLSTAQGKVRMKEIGVKKVIGAGRKHLIEQFIFESVILVLLAVFVSQLIILICLPAFNYLTDLKLSFLDLYSLQNIFALVMLSIGIVLLAGIYPAFYLTSYSPIVAIKTNSTTGEKGITLRKALVVTQFTISIALIASTLIVRSQVNYMLDHDPGFNKTNVMAIRFQDTLSVSNYKAIKAEMLQLKNVTKVAQSSTLPGDPPDRKITQVEGKTPGVINEIPLEPIWIDPDYFDLMQIHLREGRLFDLSRGTDLRESFVVNESAAKKLGWDKSIDKKIIWGRGPRKRDGKVIGVVRDIFTTSLKNEVDPIVFICDENPSKAYNIGYLLVRMNTTNKEKSVAEVAEVWAKFDKVHPIDYKFLDENIVGLYSAEEKTNALFQYLSLLTIFIACLGLLGLVSFSISQRVKEIGIRKVLGASVAQINIILSKDFLKLVAVAFIIAVPLGWYAMQKWLQDFAFKTSIHWWTFILAGCIAFAIAILTISFQGIKASLANPVKSLRTE